MELNRKIHFPSYNDRVVTYDEPSTCPLCKHSIKPEELNLHAFKNGKNETFFSLMYLCNHCYQTFVVLYRAFPHDRLTSCESKLQYIGPDHFTEQTFDQSISDLSPQFVKIYNQSLAAECSRLDEIAGLGYRKALEFLTKDFCIHRHPNDEEKIKSLPLAKCITTYVDNDMIKTLAERSTWIGNDEAHYIRKHTDRDVQDMKSFIKAMVYFVGMVLITEDASSMSPA